MSAAVIQERLRAFLDFADCQRLRGNEHAALEAEEDARRLLLEHETYDEGEP